MGTLIKMMKLNILDILSNYKLLILADNKIVEYHGTIFIDDITFKTDHDEIKINLRIIRGLAFYPDEVVDDKSDMFFIHKFVDWRLFIANLKIKKENKYCKYYEYNELYSEAYRNLMSINLNYTDDNEYIFFHKMFINLMRVLKKDIKKTSLRTYNSIYNPSNPSFVKYFIACEESLENIILRDLKYKVFHYISILFRLNINIIFLERIGNCRHLIHSIDLLNLDFERLLNNKRSFYKSDWYSIANHVTFLFEVWQVIGKSNNLL